MVCSNFERRSSVRSLLGRLLTFYSFSKAKVENSMSLTHSGRVFKLIDKMGKTVVTQNF